MPISVFAAFGIGSMIYSGLELGQYFELERNTKCHNVLLALTPATRMAFIFIQMYFIFLNNEVLDFEIKDIPFQNLVPSLFTTWKLFFQEMKIYKHRVLARFGLMHMVATNLSVWLNVLIQETKHEILSFYNPENNTLGLPQYRPVHTTLNCKYISQFCKWIFFFFTFPPRKVLSSWKKSIFFLFIDNRVAPSLPQPVLCYTPTRYVY